MFLDKWWNEFTVCPKWYQIHRDTVCYYRRFGMVSYEVKRYYADMQLEKECNFKFVRRRRAPMYLNAWWIERTPSCYTSKSWKKLYKVRKQYLKPKYHDEDYFEIVKLPESESWKVRQMRKQWRALHPELYNAGRSA